MSERDALIIKFTKVLPRWLRRCGLTDSEIADAAQDALVAALVKLRENPDGIPMADASARHELMCIVTNVARQVQRQAQKDNDRYQRFGNVEMPSARDEEVWTEARMLVLTALGKLDEPTRALIFAHEIEGQTNVEIAAKLKLKEDAVERRVAVAKQRLRAEIEKLNKVRTHGSGRDSRGGPGTEGAFLFGAGFDSFDRAVFGALDEVLNRKPILSSLLSVLKKQSFGLPTVSTTILMGTLVLAPSSSPAARDVSVPQEKHVSSVNVPGTEPSTAGLTEEPISPMPFAFLVQGCASRPPDAVAPAPTVEAAPAPAPAEEEEVRDLAKELRKIAEERDGSPLLYNGDGSPRVFKPRP